MNGPTNAFVIAAERQRERIPTAYLMEFDGITNAELASMRDDIKCPQDWRTYAGWEVAYRAAVGLNFFYDAAANVVKRELVA